MAKWLKHLQHWGPRPWLDEWYDHALYSRLNDKLSGAIVLIMHRLHESLPSGIDPGDDRVGLPHVAGALAPPGKRISFSASKACGNYRLFAVNPSPSHP